MKSNMKMRYDLVKHDALLTKGEYRTYSVGDGIAENPEIVHSFWEENDPDACRHAYESLDIHCCGSYFNGSHWSVEEWGIQEVELYEDEDGDEEEVYGDLDLADPRYLVSFDGKAVKAVYSPEEARKIAEGHPDATLEDRRECWLDPYGDVEPEITLLFPEA